MKTEYQLPRESDFPHGTQFYIKEFDVPLALEPDNKWFNWFGGVRKSYDVSGLKVDNNWQAESFAEWLTLVKNSLK